MGCGSIGGGVAVVGRLGGAWVVVDEVGLTDGV